MTLADYFFIFGAKYLFLLAPAVASIWLLRLPKDQKRKVAAFGLIALPAIYVAAKIGSALYFDPRPFVVGGFSPLIPHKADNGFPSDHTLITAAIASVVYYFNKNVSTAIWWLAVMVGISRVYAGVHHPVDILGSLAIAAIVSWAVWLVFEKFYKKGKNTP